MDNQGYIVLPKKPIWENIWFLFFYNFENLYMWKWVSRDASGRPDTKIK